MYPQQIFKGKKMAGQLGHEQVTVRTLRLHWLTLKRVLSVLLGAVPGPRKGIVILRRLNNGSSYIYQEGTKAATAAKLDKSVFGVEVKSHELEASIRCIPGNGRENLAVVRPWSVSGGGKQAMEAKGYRPCSFRF
jgi:hypothetical protein